VFAFLRLAGLPFRHEHIFDALATMLIRGRDVAMVFADIRLPGAMDGIDLAREVRIRWPFLPVILTSGHPRDNEGEGAP